MSPGAVSSAGICRVLETEGVDVPRHTVPVDLYVPGVQAAYATHADDQNAGVSLSETRIPFSGVRHAPLRTCADQGRARAKGREAGGAGAGCGPRRAGASSWARRASRQRSGRVRKRVRGADWKSKMRSDRATKSARPGRMHARAEECAESVSSAYLGTQTQGPTQFHSGRRCTSRSPSPRCSCCRSGRPCTTMRSPG